MNKELMKKILKFRNDRDWRQFHTLENLSKSISIEANELLECFQWGTQNSTNEEIEDELADIAMYLYLFVDEMNIDLEKAIENKIKKNNKKYPVSKSKGNSTKYTKL